MLLRVTTLMRAPLRRSASRCQLPELHCRGGLLSRIGARRAGYDSSIDAFQER